jgi:hypothetical protein
LRRLPGGCVFTERSLSLLDPLILLDLPVADVDDAVGAGGDVLLVRDDDDLAYELKRTVVPYWGE